MVTLLISLKEPLSGVYGAEIGKSLGEETRNLWVIVASRVLPQVLSWGQSTQAIWPYTAHQN